MTHVWELGGGRSLSKLIEVVLTPETAASAVAAIVLDLSNPSSLVEELRYWVKLLKSRAEDCAAKLAAKTSGRKRHARLQALLTARSKRLESHEDAGKLACSPLPILVVGAKCDLAKERNAEQLKVVAHTLRAIAHKEGLSIFYTSHEDRALLHAFHSAVQCLEKEMGPGAAAAAALDPERKGGAAAEAEAAGGRRKSGLAAGPQEMRHMFPLRIGFGLDSFAQIGHPRDPGAGARAKPEDMIYEWTSLFTSRFPPDNDGKEDGGSLGSKNNPLEGEKAIDMLVAQKVLDLKRMRREKDLKRRMKAS